MSRIWQDHFTHKSVISESAIEVQQYIKERSQPSRYQRQSAKPTGDGKDPPQAPQFRLTDKVIPSEEHDWLAWPCCSPASTGIAAVSMRKRMIKVIPWLA
ncbi:hypothetical protein MHYP_G00023150 [Metynnis hypsauchen]